VTQGRSSPESVPPATAVEIRAALDHILASEPFAHVERPCRFLRHLVENALHGEQSTLKESLLGMQVFGREASWDPRVDPVVRQEAARLRKRLARYYQNAAPEVRIELPVGTYVPVFRRVLPAQPEPLLPPREESRPVPVPDIQPVEGSAPRKGLRFAAGALVIAGLAGAWQFVRTRSPAAPSIVVLPFKSLSADPANAYFADGLTDEITDELVRIKSLRVLARTSAFAFQNRGADLREVGRRLSVTHVLEGSVERFGDQVRISAHLERVSDGSHLWAGTYDRQVKDLFAVQSELAAAIARSLQVNSVLPSPARHVPNEGAHELYLRAVFEMQNVAPSSLLKAQAGLNQAVQIDPDYAAAWFRLGLAKFNLSPATGRGRTPAEVSEIKGLYRKALSLDPNLSDAHANLGLIAMIYDWDWPGAERELRIASREGPNAFVEYTYGLMLSYHGSFREADQRMASALALDPANPAVMVYLGGMRYWESRFPEAIAICRDILERYPDQLNPQFMLNLAYVQSGQADVALTNVRALESRYPPMRFFEVMALARLGRREEGLRQMRRLENEYEGDPRVFRQWFALAWAYLGDHAQAVKWLERSADLHELQILNLAVNPAFAELHADPGFRALIKRIGLM